jgi:hypothetical protein
LNAENLGMKTIDNEIIDFLNMEIEEKLKTILSVFFLNFFLLIFIFFKINEEIFYK